MLSVIKNLNERIRKVRKDNKMTRPIFAKSLFISISYLGEIESGKKTPSDSLLLLIALRYAVDFTWLKRGNMPCANAVAEFITPYGLPDDLTEILAKLKFIYKDGTVDDVAKVWGIINAVNMELKRRKEAEDKSHTRSDGAEDYPLQEKKEKIDKPA